MITQAGTVSVNVRDQDKAKAFYTEKLGFEVIRDEPMMPPAESPRWIEVAPRGAQTHFVLFTAPGMEDQIGTDSRIVLHCDGIEQTAKELRGRGVEFVDEPRQEPWGWWASFKDLDGNTFGLWAPPA
jgi:predicted enzyme related to lactoylglutathione lyase